MTNNPIDKKDLLDVVNKELESFHTEIDSFSALDQEHTYIHWLSGNVNALEKLKETLQLTTTTDDQ
jgi:hypothetical protein